MPVYIALLRAVNVGGTGRLPMSDLKAMCERIGFESVQTYIASGNVVFKSSAPAGKVKRTLESALATYADKPVGVIIRTASSMKSILDGNPFTDAEPNKAIVLFLDSKAKQADITDASGIKNEQLALGNKALYVHYPDGIGTSKLKIPIAKQGTARNLNTVRKMILMAEKL